MERNKFTFQIMNIDKTNQGNFLYEKLPQRFHKIFNKFTNFLNIIKRNNKQNYDKELISILLNYESSAQISLKFYLIALIAKLFNENKINENLIYAFRKEFPIEENDTELKNLFLMAYKDNLEATTYAIKICSLFPRNESLYNKLMIILLKLANIKGYITVNEINYMKKVSKIFGFFNKDLELMMRKLFLPTNLDTYQLTGLDKDTEKSVVSNSYKEFVKKYHPDKYIQYPDIAKEYASLMEEKFSLISAAYKKVLK